MDSQLFQKLCGLVVRNVKLKFNRLFKHVKYRKKNKSCWKRTEYYICGNVFWRGYKLKGPSYKHPFCI